MFFGDAESLEYQKYLAETTWYAPITILSLLVAVIGCWLLRRCSKRSVVLLRTSFIVMVLADMIIIARTATPEATGVFATIGYSIGTFSGEAPRIVIHLTYLMVAIYCFKPTQSAANPE